MANKTEPETLAARVVRQSMASKDLYRIKMHFYYDIVLKCVKNMENLKKRRN
jgi:hypothetical protein